MMTYSEVKLWQRDKKVCWLVDVALLISLFMGWQESEL